jgi:hypothetical protein
LAEAERDDFIVIKIKSGEPLRMPYRESIDFFYKPQIRLLDHDPFKIDRLEEDLSEAEKRYREFRMTSINELVDSPDIFDSKWRNKAINFLSRKEGFLKKSVLFELLKQYWAHGCDDNAVLPGFSACGAVGVRKKVTKNTLGRKDRVPIARLVLTNDMKEKILKGFKKFYIENEKNSLTSAHVDFLAFENLKGVNAPSLRQFIYWGRELNDAIEIIKKRTGTIKYLKGLRLLKGTVRDNAFGPMSEVMIDCTIDNVRVLSTEFRDRYIGRLTIYFTVDVFSGLITGVYITPEHPSYLTGCMCVVNTTEDKVEFCNRYGIYITEDLWPSCYVPFKIIADRGEFLADAASSLTKNLKINLTNTPSYRPDLKSLVEVQMGVFQSKLKGILNGLGLIDKNDEPRITKDSRKQATLTLNDMMALIIREILFYNKNHWMDDYPLTPDMRRDNINPTPLEIFNWAKKNGLGNFRKLDKTTVWRNCLPTKTCSVSRKGIFIKPYHFFPVDEKYDALIHNFSFGKTACEVSYNPSDCRQTFLRYDGKMIPLEPKQEINFQSYFEMENFLQDLGEKKILHKRQALDDEVEKRQEQNKIIREAKARRPKKIEIENVRENRKKEINRHRETVLAQVDPEVTKGPPRKTEPKKRAHSSGLPSLTDTLNVLFDN